MMQVSFRGGSPLCRNERNESLGRELLERFSVCSSFSSYHPLSTQQTLGDSGDGLYPGNLYYLRVPQQGNLMFRQRVLPRTFVFPRRITFRRGPPKVLDSIYFLLNGIKGWANGISMKNKSMKVLSNGYFTIFLFYSK